MSSALELVNKLEAWDAYKKAHNELKLNMKMFIESFLDKPRETLKEKEMHDLLFKYYQEAFEKYKKFVDLFEENKQEKEKKLKLYIDTFSSTYENIMFFQSFEDHIARGTKMIIVGGTAGLIGGYYIARALFR